MIPVSQGRVCIGVKIVPALRPDVLKISGWLIQHLDAVQGGLGDEALVDPADHHVGEHLQNDIGPVNVGRVVGVVPVGIASLAGVVKAVLRSRSAVEIHHDSHAQLLAPAQKALQVEPEGIPLI